MKRLKNAAREKVAEKYDPRLVAMARELRDRWMEAANAGGAGGEGGQLQLEAQGKYEVGRMMGVTRVTGGGDAQRRVVVVEGEVVERRLLPAA